MKKIQFVFVLVLSLVLFSCGPAMKDTWTKENYKPKSFEKILVIGAFNSLEARTAFENTVVQKLADHGVVAENSLMVLPPTSKITEVTEESIIQAVKDGGYDGVIVSSLIDVNTKDVRESGGGYFVAPYRYGYGRYAYARVGYINSSDYYRQQNSYLVESSLFDAKASSKEEALLWTGQSSVTDPSTYKSGAKDYAKRLTSALIKSNVILGTK